HCCGSRLSPIVARPQVLDGGLPMTADLARGSVERLLRAAAGALVGVVLATADARAADAITYLFPAPPSLPAFGPIRLAQGKGYFKQADIEVQFAVGRGGVDVAKQVGAGNAPLGGIVADGPILVRSNGVPIK